MMRKLLALCGFLLLASPAIAAPLAPVSNDAAMQILRVPVTGGGSQSITLGLNKALTIEFATDVKDVDFAAPDIVDAVPKSPRRYLLIANKLGQTNAFFTDANGRRVLSLDIRVERDVTDLASLMQASLPKSSIKVTAINDNIVLAGNVANAMEVSRAVNLAAGVTGDPKKVVNMLSVAGGEQVMLKVRVAEMSRSIAKQFGVNISGAVNVDGVPIISSTSNPYGLLGHALSDASGTQIGSVCAQAFNPSTTGTITNTILNDAVSSNNANLQQPGIVSGTIASTVNTTSTCASANNAQGILNGLEQVGLVHMLAEPDLVAVTGETAKFLAGGEFPVPTAKDNQGNVTLEFKQYGVGLSFTPVVLSPERISIQLSTEVSQLSSTGAYTLAGGTEIINGVTETTPGLTIPALQVRRTETTVEMSSGSSIAIAGLMQHVTSQTIDGFPGLKDMPVLGALFRSRDFENDETELVVLVTAYLVQPNTESALAAPTDGFVQPSDPETLLLGRLNAVYKNDTPTQGQTAAAGGYIVQ